MYDKQKTNLVLEWYVLKC